MAPISRELPPSFRRDFRASAIRAIDLFLQLDWDKYCISAGVSSGGCSGVARLVRAGNAANLAADGAHPARVNRWKGCGIGGEAGGASRASRAGS